MPRRAILLALIPAALLAQSQSGHVLIGDPDDGGKLQVAGTAMIAKPRVWRGDDGSRWTWDATTGHPHRLPDKIRWAEYGFYFAAVGADYGSTRYALSHGATDTVWRCSPHRPGCMNQGLFWGVAATHAGLWLMHDLFLRKYTPQKWRKFEQFNRKFFIGARFGAAAYNFGIGQGMKTR